jgi:hypothetical protein
LARSGSFVVMKVRNLSNVFGDFIVRSIRLPVKH